MAEQKILIGRVNIKYDDQVGEMEMSPKGSMWLRDDKVLDKTEKKHIVTFGKVMEIEKFLELSEELEICGG